MIHPRLQRNREFLSNLHDAPRMVGADGYVAGVYQLVASLGNRASLNEVWSVLNGLDPIGFADILEMNGAAPTDLAISGLGSETVSGGFAIPRPTGPIAVDATIPLTSRGSATFNRVGLLIVDANNNVVLDTDYVDIGFSTANATATWSGNTVTITLSAALQADFDSLAAVQYQISVYGGWFGVSNRGPEYSVDTGRYFSMFRPISIQ